MLKILKIVCTYCFPPLVPIDIEKDNLIDVPSKAPLDLLAGLAWNESQLDISFTKHQTHPNINPLNYKRTSLIVDDGSQAVGRILSELYEDKTQVDGKLYRDLVKVDFVLHDERTLRQLTRRAQAY